jgi:hypothetical protein
MSIDATLKHIEGVISYFKKYRDEGFISNMDTAKNIASELDIEPIFSTKRQRKRKKHFDEQDEDDEIQQFVVDSFKREYFLVMIDNAIALLTTRFEKMTTFDNVFGFSFNSENLKSLDEVDLWAYCKIFMDKFSHDNSSDVEINDFFFRIKGVASDFARFFNVSA